VNKIALGLLLAACIATARAGPSGFYAPSLGIGQRPCSEWTNGRLRGGSQRQFYASWALGYVSGYNQFGPAGKQLFLQYDAEKILQFLDESCARNPKVAISEIAAQFIFDLTRTPQGTN